MSGVDVDKLVKMPAASAPVRAAPCDQPSLPSTQQPVYHTESSATIQKRKHIEDIIRMVDNTPNGLATLQDALDVKFAAFGKDLCTLFRGHFEGRSVTALIDAGAWASFVCGDWLSRQQKLKTKPAEPLRVRLATGPIATSNQ